MVEDDYYFYLLGKIRDWLAGLIPKLLPVLPKLLGIFVLNFILMSAVFHWFGASLTNQDVYIASMVLLLALFADLKEFNFWGIKGTKIEEEKLKELAEDPGTALPPNAPQAPPEQQALSTEPHPIPPQPTYLMDDLTANFLYLSFEIEKLLRQAATRLSGSPISTSMPLQKLVDILLKKEFLTPQGKERIEAIRKLRNHIVHGRSDEVSRDSLYSGWNLAYNLYKELYNWLNPQTPMV
jgi:hypothetical protein